MDTLLRSQRWGKVRKPTRGGKCNLKWLQVSLMATHGKHLQRAAGASKHSTSNHCASVSAPFLEFLKFANPSCSHFLGLRCKFAWCKLYVIRLWKLHLPM